MISVGILFEKVQKHVMTGFWEMEMDALIPVCLLILNGLAQEEV